MDEILLTPSALLNFLTQIDELANCDIQITEGTDSSISVSIGDSVYTIGGNATEIPVADNVLEQVDDANMEGYGEAMYYSESEYIESGVISELAKTLMVGGLVRLTKRLLK